MQACCGTAEMQFLRDGDEVAQQAQVHSRTIPVGYQGSMLNRQRAQEADVPVLERGETGDVFVLDVVALGANPGNDGVQASDVPQDHGVEDQTDSGEPVLSEPAHRAPQL
ncbi:hypothetical protein GCM10023335_67590 [Streptomyces siamensis]|uniref:Uncharacterized protein n=1 Tax=Streptomyces siamensis TaxID=1274986 RepID=A0ABP9JGR4_9ACTN